MDHECIGLGCAGCLLARSIWKETVRVTEQYAVKIPVDGTIEPTGWSMGSLGPAYEAIGTQQVEMVSVTDLGLHLWFDEESRMKRERPGTNVRASRLAGIEILGTVLVTPATDTPDSPGWTYEMADALSDRWNNS